MEIPHSASLLDGLELCTSHVRSISTKPLTRAAELCDAVPKGACFAKILLNFRQILTKNFRDFSNFSKTKHTANVCWAVPQAGRFSETFAGFCTRPVCPFLASSCARPAAALRDLPGDFDHLLKRLPAALRCLVLLPVGPRRHPLDLLPAGLAI